MKAVISVYRRVKYTSIVEISEQDFSRLDRILDEGTRSERIKAEEELNNLIDTSDWQDEELDHLDEFSEYDEEPAQP